MGQGDKGAKCWGDLDQEKEKPDVLQTSTLVPGRCEVLFLVALFFNYPNRPRLIFWEDLV